MYIYKKYVSASPEFLYAAEKTYRREYDKEAVNEEFHKISSFVTAPVITAYVLFILKQCVERDIKRVYFLSDMFCKIACVLCKNAGIDIECRFVSCSEEALKPAVYNIAGDEAFDMMFGKKSSAYSVLSRAEFNEDERRMIYGELEFDFENENNALDNDEREKLKNNEKFANAMKRISESAYKNAKEYFAQEGFLDDISYALAGYDMTASVHGLLGRLLSDAAGKKRIFDCFWFGLHERPESEEYGEDICWYFNYNSPLKYRTKFNSRLFECMCSGQEGCIKGYKKVFGDDRYIPAADDIPEENSRLYAHQTECAEAFAANLEGIFGTDKFNEALFHSMTEDMLICLMYYPSEEEAEAMGGFMIPYSGGFRRLAESADAQKLSENMLTKRIGRYLSDDEKGVEGFDWDYGTLALTKANDKFLYRISFNLWDKAKFFINSI